MPKGQQLEILDREECLRLLRTVQVGRLVFIEGGQPAVQPVNFRTHLGNVVIRVAGGAKLDAAIGKAVVAFEADELDPELRFGWSVTVVGHAELITDIDELVAVSGTWLRSWVDGWRHRFIRIRAEKVTGRRLHTPAGSTIPVSPDQNSETRGT
jgi:nitroimidazol reductase NimA-like FMN-containing flavoprotein (pyridoxamine 5'-phosphate oxidase superfamily)